MTDKLTPVRCGCGGEAKIDWALQPDGVYITGVYCENCGTKTIPFWGKEKDKAIDYAVTTWNRAMGNGDKLSPVERTAKAEYSDAAGEYLCKACGHVVQIEDLFCCGCGAKLDWSGRHE